MKKILGLILTFCMLIPILSVTPASAKQKEQLQYDDVYYTVEGYRITAETTVGDIVENTTFEAYKAMETHYSESTVCKIGEKIKSVEKYEMPSYSSYSAYSGEEGLGTPFESTSTIFLKNKSGVILCATLSGTNDNSLSNCVINRLYPNDGYEYWGDDEGNGFGYKETLEENFFEQIGGKEIKKNDTSFTLWNISFSGNIDKDIEKVGKKIPNSKDAKKLGNTIFVKVQMKSEYKDYYGVYMAQDNWTYPFSGNTEDRLYSYLYISYSKDADYVKIGTLTFNSPLMSKAEIKALKKQVKEKKAKDNAYYISYNNLFDDKGKLYISKYGIAESRPFYLCGWHSDNGWWIKDILKNTDYKLYDSNGNKIDINADKTAYDKKYLYGKMLKNASGSYSVAVYSDYWGDKDFNYIKDMKLKFGEFGIDEFRENMPTIITAPNDYYLKKVFSIKNAPSLDNFKKEFMNKMYGGGKDLVSITSCHDSSIYADIDSYVGYVVKIPYISKNKSYLTITYKYNEKTRECKKIDWDFG